jgi:hypothetical protein
VGLPTYKPPGSGNLTDGFSLRVTGDEDVQARLLGMGPAVKAALLKVLKEAGAAVASQAGRNAPVGPKRGRRKGGNLSRSFGVFARPGWEKFGVIGVAVRSKARYHYFQEFGVDAPGTQVLLHRDVYTGNKVAAGQGIRFRYRDGTNRLNPNVSVKSYRRDIRIQGKAPLGRATVKLKGQLAGELQEAIGRLLAGGGVAP